MSEPGRQEKDEAWWTDYQVLRWIVGQQDKANVC